MTATAAPRQISGISPTAMPPPSGTDALARWPTSRRRVSAENVSKRPFCTMIESPNVISSGGRMLRPSVRLSSTDCSAKPTANISGTTTATASTTGTPIAASASIRNAEHDQVAVGEVDQPHDAEDHRQAGGIE